MRLFVIAAASAVVVAWAIPAGAAAKKTPPPGTVVERSAAGTVIQPTTTIIPGPGGQRTLIVIPRQRSYLDTGTEMSVGDGSFQDYVFPPGGDPGRSNWFFGPDLQGRGRYPLPSAFDGMGINPNTP